MKGNLDAAINCLKGVSMSMNMAGKLVANLTGVIKCSHDTVKTDGSHNLLRLFFQKDIEAHRGQFQSRGIFVLKQMALVFQGVELWNARRFVFFKKLPVALVEIKDKRGIVRMQDF